MSRPLNKEKAVALSTRLLLWLVLLLLIPSALAQNNLGELLDGGAKKLSGDEFRQDVVQRVVFGPLPSGADVEIIYSTTGVIQGRSLTVGSAPIAGGVGSAALLPIDGVWTIDDRGRICASMAMMRTFLPFRCQYWFRYKDDYFIADSDDRSGKVFRRTVKQ